MKALTLEEFAQELRRSGDIRTMDIADEILALLDLEEEVADPYSALCVDLEHYAPDHTNAPAKALEWLGDRSNLLEEIEKQFTDAGHDGDADDLVREMLGTLAAAKEILEEHGWPGTDFLDALENLAENAPTPKEYDL